MHDFVGEFFIDEGLIDDIGKDGSMASIPCKIKGFWSRDALRLYVRRDIDWALTRSSDKEKANWSFEISRSSGGRDTDEESCDIIANMNYARALTALCNLALDLQGKVELFEKNFQEYCENLLEYDRKRLAEKEAKLAADPALTKEQAEWFLSNVIARAKQTDHWLTKYELFIRGKDYSRDLEVRCGASGKVTFSWAGVSYSRKKVMELLQTSISVEKLVLPS
jgi:hypothetical protein